MANRVSAVRFATVDERAERIGRNEALFRVFNEGVRRVSERFNEGHRESFGVVLPDDLEIICECGERECDERIAVSGSDYERVRSDGALFFIRPGHEKPDVETVVERQEEWWVVRKHEGDPAHLARETDPRPGP
jgi:hypothetical protein